MTTPRNRFSRSARRKGRGRNIIPTLERFEERQLLSTGFVQGFVRDSSGNPVDGATVSLYTTGLSPSEYAQTTTNSVGYYGFTGVAPGTYDVVESAAGESTSTGSIYSTVNPASAVNNGTEFQVTVENLSTLNSTTPPTVSVTWESAPYTWSSAGYELNPSSYNSLSYTEAYSSTDDPVGTFDDDVSGNPGNLHQIFTYCSDIPDGVVGPPSNTFSVDVSLTPNTTSLQTNLGELAYLYNTYGTSATVALPSSFNPPDPSDYTASVDGAGLQLALWALEYNPDGTLNVDDKISSDPFAVNDAVTSPYIINAANAYLNDAANNKPESVYFLNYPSPANNSTGGQGMLCTDLLDFTNTLTTQSIPTITTSQQPLTAVVGSSIADTATVTGLVDASSSDTVTFNLYSSATTQDNSTLLFTDTETVNLNGGTATATSANYTAGATGTDYWVATFNGDSNNMSVTSTPTAEPVTITTATPAINTTQQPASAVVGSTIADQATVTGYSPTGTVTFDLYNNSSASGTPLFTDTENLVNGVATSASYTATATGTDYWVATYNGDTNNSLVTSTPTAEPVTITPFSPTINTTQQPASAVVGSTIADQATVTGYSPTGTVTFDLYNNSSASGTPLFTDTENLVNGVATSASYTATATGTDYWVATYNGDTNNSLVTSTPTAEPVTITPFSPTINTTQQPASAVVGSTIADQATVTGYSPTGTVTFDLYNNSSASGTPLFTDTENLVNGVATSASYTATATGTDYWVATYNGDTNNSLVTSTPTAEPVTITPFSPTINTTQQPASAVVGSTIADQATVTGYSPTGTVTFDLYNNSSASGTPLFTDTENLVNGVATSASYTATATGTDYWVATYNGDTNNSLVTSSPTAEPVTITPFSPTINTTQQPASAVVGSTIADQATVTGYSPTGTVTFDLYNNSSASGTPLFTDTENLVNGVATSASYTATATGTDYWVATYNGDTNNSLVTSSPTAEPVTITPFSPTINTTQQPASAVVGSTIADQATVTGYSPTGTVTFDLYNNSSASGTPLFTDTENLVNGVATSASYTATATGTDYWVATYNGDTNNSLVTSSPTAEPVTITPFSPTINTTQQPASAVVGSTIADQATVTGYNPTGTVTFDLYNNSSASGTPLFTDTENLVNGVATSASYTATATGTDYWVATYNGDTNNSLVTSTPTAEPVTVTQSSPGITTTPSETPTTGGITISGTKYLDLTGNGFSSDDTPQGGVTIDLYQPTSKGGETLVATTTTASNGTYTFTGVNPGTYYVQEVVPSGYIQTGGGPDGTAGDTYYTVSAASGYSYSGYNFDDFLIPTCTPVNVTYKITTPSGHSTTVTDLAGNTAQGDTVTATFTVPPGMNDTLTLVSYEAPSSSFSDSNAYEQVIYQQDTETFGPGNYSLTVKIPNTYYQIDFVCGQAINELEPNQNNDAYGPDSANVMYHAEDRFISSDNSGTTCPSLQTPQNPSTPNPTMSSTAGMNLNDSATLTGGYNATGTIIFYLMPPGSISSTPLSDAVYTDTVTVDGNGTYTTTNMGNNPGGYDATTTGTYQWVAVYSGDTNNQSVTSPFGSEPATVSPSGSITGTVYCDMNVDDCLDNGDEGIAGVTVDLLSGTTVVATTTTSSNGVYSFTGLAPSGASGYTVEIVTPSGDFTETANVGTVNGATDGKTVTNADEITSVVLNGTTQSVGINYNFPLLQPSSLSGEVIDDGKDDGKQDSCDQGLADVTVTLTGTNYLGKAISPMTTTTNSSGDYTFTGLAPGTYTITVTPLSGFTADADSVGTVNGSTDGSACSKSSINTIELGGCGDAGINYVFSLVGSSSCSTQTQSCSYWCGSSGQSLINCLNGNSSCTNLGNWLASTCPNLFGGLKGCTNSQIASYCKSWSDGSSSQKACAQVLSTALCAYVTNSNLCGNAGSSYGFSVSENGLGASTCNVSSYGSGIGLSNNGTYSIQAVLSQIDSQCSNGSIKSSAVSTISSLCSKINGS